VVTNVLFTRHKNNQSVLYITEPNRAWNRVGMCLHEYRVIALTI